MLMDQGDCNTVVKTAAIVCNLQIAADARLQGTIMACICVQEAATWCCLTIKTRQPPGRGTKPINV